VRAVGSVAAVTTSLARAVGSVASRAAVAALIVASVAQAAAEPCAPRAELAGDAVAVERVTTELAALGVQRGRPAPGCRGVSAQVELAPDGGIAVAIRDGGRRSEGRVVGDAAVAASWIDSWLRDDLDGTAWLLASPTAPLVAPVAAPNAVVAPRGSVVAGRSVFDRVALTATYEQSWLDDGASANGGSVAACVRVGMLCLGARARYAREADRVVNLTAMARSDTALIATVALPVTAGRMTIAPELGIGVGRESTRRIEGCAPPPPAMMQPNCDPSDPTSPNCQAPPVCMDANGTSKLYVGDGLNAATFTPRFAAALRIAVPLFDHVWLDGVAALELGPFAHTSSFGATGNGMNADGTMGTMDTALPGESQRTYVLGVGLRVGAP
jgi:hypothetical protein